MKWYGEYMSSLPTWARKPKHKKTVIATDRGWVVKDTGEVLKRVNDLPAKLKSLVDEVSEVVSVLDTPVEAPEITSTEQKVEAVDTITKTENITQSDSSEPEKQEAVVTEKPKAKRRGRPPKKKV